MLYEVPLSRVDEMADVCAEAFIANNDPIGNFIFQEEPNHLILKKRFFRSLVTSCSAKAVRHGLSPALEAASIWFPPGMGHSEDVETDSFNAQDFENAETMKKMQAVNKVITALTIHLGQEPQWYLHLVAVSSQFKGQGYSSQLIKPMLIKAESDNLPCTLITQSVENVQKYEHWGFKLVKEMPVFCSQEKFYSMRKD
jgi:N-acetylglutamate synthase-like GNAT family acetyltransferase